MYNIPDEVKALLREDGVRKNLRVSFPDGQHRDLTNSDIVRESMRFCESVCSRSSFSFGLAEASTIEFETVGIPNILGYRIFCAIEVDATTLPAEMRTPKPDVDYPVYEVPLGLFTVNSCPRNQQAMTHRRVKAQSLLDASAQVLSPFLQVMCGRGIKAASRVNTVFSMDAFLRLNGYDNSPIDPAYISAVSYAGVHTSDDNSLGGNLFVLQGTSTYRPVHCLFGCSMNKRSLEPFHRFDDPDGDIAALRRWRLADGNGIAPTRVSRARLREIAEANAAWLLDAAGPAYKKNADGTYIELTEAQTAEHIYRYLVQFEGLYINLTWVGPRSAFGPGQNLYAPVDGWTPTLTGDAGWSMFADVYYPYSVTVYVVGSQPRIEGETALLTTEDLSSATLTWTQEAFYKSDADRTPYEKLCYSVHSKLTETTDTDSKNLGYYVFPEDQILDLFLSDLEMRAQFVKYGHDGKPSVIGLDPSSPIELTPADYSSCWWDEYDVQPVGCVEYESKGSPYAYTFDTTSDSVYSLSHNRIFNTAKPPKEAEAAILLEQTLVPHLRALRFTPIELEAIGMPWAEAGDAIEIEADDGTIVESYIFERQLRGIQHLSDSITAEGVTIEEASI